MEQDLILRQERRSRYPIMPSLETDALPSNSRNICSMQVNLCLVLKHTIRKNTKRKLKGIVLR